MIYGVIGDIHSNYDALTAVIDELQQENVDKILCVGDIVGYAAEPVACIELLIELNCISVAGNHDYAVVDKFPVGYFHADARAAVFWTREQLSHIHRNYLQKLPLVVELDEITLVHGSLNHPECFYYIVTEPDAQLSLDLLETPICFYGHTHVPLAILLDNGIRYVERGSIIDLNAKEKALINVGSVGQPRDWDLRACCVVYDSEKKIVKTKRVKYNIKHAVEKIYEAGLPGINALRLTESIS
ncbi:MAG: metallophosphoesterase [wastewater metagenome]|nr:metallophosphoesterase [Candidatus Loosdrechtia aerotolerans]